MKSIKAFSVIVIATLGIGVLAGCSNTKSKATSGTPTIKILCYNWTFDPNADPVKAALEERGGVKIEAEMLPATDPMTKLNLLMSSGAEYDLVKKQYEDYAQLAATGNFVDLTDLIKNYPNLAASEPEINWEMLRVNGRLYGLPLQRTMEAGTRGIIYRADILRDLNIPVPTTPEEFLAALRQVKAATGKIPFTFAPTFAPLSWQRDIIASAFGFTTAYDNYVTPDNKVQNYIKHPNFLKYVAFMRTLYQEGLLDPEFASNGLEQAQQKLVADNLVFSQFDWHFWQSLATFRKNIPNGELAFLPALKAPDGSQIVGRDRGQGTDEVVMIPKSSKQVDVVLKFLDTIATRDNYDYVYDGSEGQEFTTISDNEWNVNAELFGKTRFTSWWWRYTGYYPLREKAFIVGIKGEGEDVSNTFISLNAATEGVQVNDPLLGMAKSAIESKNLSALRTIINDFLIQAITSPADLTTMYNRMIGVWESEGGLDTINDLNNIYTAWKK